ncbi:MAG: YggU family protein [bacterium]|nr:MAG: YggU family protein [bacterium]
MREINSRQNDRVGFRVHVQPSAPRDELLGWNAAGELRVRIAAPAVKGKANKRLIAFLAKQFSVTKREIVIESGERSRCKIVSAPQSIRQTLEEIAED